MGPSGRCFRGLIQEIIQAIHNEGRGGRAIPKSCKTRFPGAILIRLRFRGNVLGGLRCGLIEADLWRNFFGEFFAGLLGSFLVGEMCFWSFGDMIEGFFL